MKATGKKTQAQHNSSIVAMLNQALAGLIALKLHAKQAHWNVKGERFISLHELFDQVATQVDGFADLVAERAVQLGGMAEGSVAHIAKRAGQVTYPQTADAAQHVKHIAQLLKAAADEARDGIDTADEQEDKVTADTLTQVASGLDKLHWFVNSHQQ